MHLLWALQEFSFTRRSLRDKQGSWRWGGEAFFLSQHSAFSSSTVFLWLSCILSLLCSLCRGLRPLPCESCPRGEGLLCTDAPASWTDSCCGVVISTHTHSILPMTYSAHRQKCKGMVSRNFNEDKVEHAMETVALEWPVLTHFRLRNHLWDNKRNSRATVSFIQFYSEWRLFNVRGRRLVTLMLYWCWILCAVLKHYFLLSLIETNCPKKCAECADTFA